MSLQKLKFKEVSNENGESQYFINNKLVTKEVYDKLYEDESLFTLPPLPKMDHSPENNIDGNGCSVDEEELCEDCQQILDIVRDIKDMNEEDAFMGLRDYLDALEARTRMETMVEVYSELGNGMNKTSARIEMQLDNFMEMYNGEDEELD